MKNFTQFVACYALIFGSAFYGASSSCYAWGGRLFGFRCQTCQTCANGQCYAQPVAAPCEAVTTLTDPIEEDKPAPCKPVEVVAPCEAVENCDAVEPCGACETCARNAKKPVFRPVQTVVNALANRLNAVRAARGCRALQCDAQLEAEALAQCKAMATRGGLFHRGGAAEICAYNYGSGIDGALNQWTCSGAHFRILFGGYTRVGVATYRDAYGRNWCCARFR